MRALAERPSPKAPPLVCLCRQCAHSRAPLLSPKAHSQPRQPVCEQHLRDGASALCSQEERGTFNQKEPEDVRLTELTKKETFRLMLNN